MNVASVGLQPDLVLSQGSSQASFTQAHASLPAPGGALGTQCPQPCQFPQEHQELNEGFPEMSASCLRLHPIVVPTTFNLNLMQEIRPEEVDLVVLWSSRIFFPSVCVCV